MDGIKTRFPIWEKTSRWWEKKAWEKVSKNKTHWKKLEKTTSWWFFPIWKICSSNWIISPRFGVKIKDTPMIHPWKLTWHWTIPIFNRKYSFKCWNFHCYLSLPECSWNLHLAKKTCCGNPSERRLKIPRDLPSPDMSAVRWRKAIRLTSQVAHLRVSGSGLPVPSHWENHF